MFGYSRDGKMATIASAIDERIAAVIAGSTGVGGVLPWRLSGERNAGEGIETTTRQFPTWFVQRLRFFSGREDRLPIDGNLLVALIAPRSILLEYGLNDEVSNSWGNEQSYYSALKAYKLLGQPERIGILRVPGFHGANDQEACLDWLDIQFGRSTRTWNNDLFFPGISTNGARTRKKPSISHATRSTPTRISWSSTTTAWEIPAGGIRKSIAWMLGDEPPRMPPVPGRGAGDAEVAADRPQPVRTWRSCPSQLTQARSCPILSTG